MALIYEKVKLGVYIQGVSGKLYETENWTGQETANGIAVCTEKCRFVIALKDAYSSECKWDNHNTKVTGVTSTAESSIAKTDYNGESNTTMILNQLGNSKSDAPAAYYCRAYAFPNGKNGYLGAAGEWQVACNNADAINLALSKCGNPMKDDAYWTSTQRSESMSWHVSWRPSSFYYSLDYSMRSLTKYARAFTSL